MSHARCKSCHSARHIRPWVRTIQGGIKHIHAQPAHRITLAASSTCNVPAADSLPKLLSEVCVEALLHGNMTKQEGLALGHKVQSILKAAPVHADSRPRDRVLQLPAGQPLCHRYLQH